jgi:hypothetical protein
LQRVRGAEAGGARADDGDIDFGGEGHDVVYSVVMPGLVPGIQSSLSVSETWMAGTSPAMTDFS